MRLTSSISRSMPIALALLASTLLAMPVGAQSAHDHGHGADTASQAYMDAMAKMDADMQSMEMTGKPGVDFARMMIPHHQSAIDMAKAYLESDERDPELTRLSEEIIAAQESEIAFLRGWLERNGE